jgi:hypothetical protein
VVAILSSGQIVFNLSHIEGITLGAGEEQIARIDEVGDRTSEGQTVGMFFVLIYKLIPSCYNMLFAAKV